jgi:hypothetical protein
VGGTESPGINYWGVKNNGRWIRSSRKNLLGYSPSNIEQVDLQIFLLTPVIYFLDQGEKSYPQFIHKKKLRMWIKKY